MFGDYFVLSSCDSAYSDEKENAKYVTSLLCLSSHVFIVTIFYDTLFSVNFQHKL